MTASNQNPFTGNGNVPEAPEFLAKEHQTVSEAIIVRIDIDGTEIPVAVTKEINGNIQFIVIQ